MLRKIAFAVLFFSFSVAAAAADRIKTPQEQFAGYPTRIDDIPGDWATTNPIFTRVCFNLQHPVNSPEANAFLRELYSTITGLELGVKVRIERTISPVQYAYCVSLGFRNWDANRRYETNEEFLSFYENRWKATVTEAHEQLTVLDQVAAGEL